MSPAQDPSLCLEFPGRMVRDVLPTTGVWGGRGDAGTKRTESTNLHDVQVSALRYMLCKFPTQLELHFLLKGVPLTWKFRSVQPNAFKHHASSTQAKTFADCCLDLPDSLHHASVKNRKDAHHAIALLRQLFVSVLIVRAESIPRLKPPPAPGRRWTRC